MKRYDLMYSVGQLVRGWNLVELESMLRVLCTLRLRQAIRKHLTEDDLDSWRDAERTLNKLIRVIADAIGD